MDDGKCGERHAVDNRPLFPIQFDDPSKAALAKVMAKPERHDGGYPLAPRQSLDAGQIKMIEVSMGNDNKINWRQFVEAEGGRHVSLDANGRDRRGVIGEPRIGQNGLAVEAQQGRHVTDPGHRILPFRCLELAQHLIMGKHVIMGRCGFGGAGNAEQAP